MKAPAGTAAGIHKVKHIDKDLSDSFIEGCISALPKESAVVCNSYCCLIDSRVRKIKASKYMIVVPLSGHIGLTRCDFLEFTTN